MSDHDPLCPHIALAAYHACLCGVIAEARADERERVAEAIEKAHYRSDPSLRPQLVLGVSLAIAVVRDGALRAGSAE